MDKIELKQFTLGDFYVNSYLCFYEDTKEAIVIDAPSGFHKIEQYAEEKRLTIKGILITHGHFDHIAGLKETDLPFYIHKDDKEFLKDPYLNFSNFSPQEFILEKEPTLYLEEGRVTLGNFFLEIIHTPGHTPGSISIRLNKWLFSGDALFSGSIGRTDFQYGSYEALIKALKEKIFVMDKDTIVLPGHGYSTTIDKEQKINPFFTEPFTK